LVVDAPRPPQDVNAAVLEQRVRELRGEMA
jgi:hypothetical protein